jgi:hypothetical protein
MVETSDLIFALDSIPAIFAVTTKAFIIFTSNVFAILGLRSLYFVLAGAIGYFSYLKYGLSLVLVFIGMKMILDPHEGVPPLPFQFEIPISTSLIVVGAILLLSVVASVVAAEREKKHGAASNPKAEGRGPKEGRRPKAEVRINQGEPSWYAASDLHYQDLCISVHRGWRSGSERAVALTSSESPRAIALSSHCRASSMFPNWQE